MNRDCIEPVFDFRHAAPGSTDTGTVSLRIYRNGRQQFLSTGVRVRRCEWSPVRWVIGREDAAELNDRIRLSIEEAKSSSRKVRPLRQSSAPFLEWVAEEIGKMNYAPDTLYRHRLMLRELEEYGKIRTFRDVTPQKIMDYLHHVAQRTHPIVVDGTVKVRPIKQVSIYAYYRRLQKWVHMAMAQDLVPGNALAGLKIPRGEYAQREHLTKAELERWLSSDLVYPHLIQVRDLFAMQCATGLAYVDLMEADFSRLEKSGGFYTLSGVRHKTHKPYYAVMLPFGREILKRYKGKLPKITNQSYNYYLKQVALICGIRKRVTTHVGRHTYACLCLQAGVRIEAVQRTLGHADVRTTQIYAKLVDQDVLAAFAGAKL